MYSFMCFKLLRVFYFMTRIAVFLKISCDFLMSFFQLLSLDFDMNYVVKSLS
jgi:hypothetical protein